MCMYHRSFEGTCKKCPRADSDHPVFRPLPNCTEFCECSNGVPYVRSCPAKLHWNPKLNTCDFPEYAGCATRTTTPAPTTTSLAPETTTSKSEEDIGTEVCLKEGVVCYGNEPEYHATSDCSKFCQCAYGRPYLKVCKDGLHFNPKLNVCDWPENAGCENSTTTEPSTTTLEPATRSAEEGTRICRDQGVTCPRVDPRTPIYSAVSHCTQFCECSNGTPYLFDCPGGTLFNENLDVCDYPYNVHCRV
nr:unnamed protein product [Callosobruchus chinensis]